MHGYELRAQLSQKLGFFWTVSFGSLYPTLKKLERRGVVEKRVMTETGTRRRQVYSITPSGEHEFLELLSERAGATWEEDKFPLRLAFFRYLKPETRIRLLERRRTYLVEKLEEGRESLRCADRRTDSYTLSLVRHGLDTTQHDIAWLEELIATERRLATGDADDEPDGGGSGTAERSAEGPEPLAAPGHAADRADSAPTR